MVKLEKLSAWVEFDSGLMQSYKNKRMPFIPALLNRVP
jgi:hypothetical protein